MKRNLKKIRQTKKIKNKNLELINLEMGDEVKKIIKGEMSLSRRTAIGIPPGLNGKGGEWYG